MSAPAAGAPLLEVGDLRVRIGGRPVVDGVAFRVDAGERVGLIGESGSGKSRPRWRSWGWRRRPRRSVEASACGAGS